MSAPMRRVVHEWPANDAGRRAAELAYARGQLVHAERVGDVVRVVLRVPGGRTPTARPWLVPAVVITGAATAVVVAVVLVVGWVLDHLALLLGAGVVALLGAALLARVAGVGGRGEHPCDR